MNKQNYLAPNARMSKNGRIHVMPNPPKAKAVFPVQTHFPKLTSAVTLLGDTAYWFGGTRLATRSFPQYVINGDIVD